MLKPRWPYLLIYLFLQNESQVDSISTVFNAGIPTAPFDCSLLKSLMFLQAIHNFHVEQPRRKGAWSPVLFLQWDGGNFFFPSPKGYKTEVELLGKRGVAIQALPPVPDDSPFRSSFRTQQNRISCCFMSPGRKRFSSRL